MSLPKCLLSCLLLASGTASAQTYTVTILDSLGGNLSWAHGINEQHQIVGVGNTGSEFRRHAIQWINGVPVDLGAGGFEESEAAANNELVQVVGWVRGGFAFHASPWTAPSWNNRHQQFRPDRRVEQIGG